MKIQIFEKSPFTEDIDANSRVALFGVNAIDTPEIVKFGNVTRTLTGGITWGGGAFAWELSPQGEYCLTLALHDGNRISYPTTFWPSITDSLAINIFKNNNNKFICKKLNLYEKNPDTVDGRLKRCYCDPQHVTSPEGIQRLSFYAADGSLDCHEDIYVINCYVTILEVKYFKSEFNNTLYILYFKPSCSRLLLPCIQCKEIFITSELGTYIIHERKNFGWLQNCGDLSKLDLTALQSRKVTFVLLEHNERADLFRYALAEALAFKTTAKKQNIEVSITRVSLGQGRLLTDIGRMDYGDCPEEKLDDKSFFRLCRNFHLPIDPVLLGDRYEMMIGNAVSEPIVKYFFDQEQVTVLQEKPKRSIFGPLLTLISGTKELEGEQRKAIRTLVVCSVSVKKRVEKQLSQANSESLHFYNITAISEAKTEVELVMSKLLDKFNPELVFVDMRGANASREERILKALDTCLNYGVGIGVLCADGNVPTTLSEIAARNLIIGAVDSETFIVKNNSINSEIEILKFDFHENKIRVHKSSEDELSKC